MSPSQFDRLAVLGAAMKLTNAGDGLSKALELDPTELHIGDRVFMVIEGLVTDTGFKSVRLEGNLAGVKRIHTVAAQNIALVDHGLVSDILDDQQRRRDERQGIQRIPFTHTPDNTPQATNPDERTTETEHTPNTAERTTAPRRSRKAQ